jgi:hypothetical protein
MLANLLVGLLVGVSTSWRLGFRSAVKEKEKDWNLGSSTTMDIY